MNKTEARKWLKRAREDIRDIEAYLKSGDDAAVAEVANDLSCVGAEIAYAFDETD